MQVIPDSAIDKSTTPQYRQHSSIHIRRTHATQVARMAIFSTILQHVLMPEALGNASTALPPGGEVDLTLPLAAIAGTFFLIVLAKSVRSLWMLPPGPWGTPLYGMMKRIDKPLHLFLTDLTKKYGNGILSFKMGQETMVVLSDYKLIKEAFKNSAMTARPKTELINEVLQGLGRTHLYYPDIFGSKLITLY